MRLPSNKSFLALLCLFLTPLFAYGQTTITLDEAIQGGAAYLRSRFRQGTRIIVSAANSDNPEIDKYAAKVLSQTLVNANWLIVIETSEDVQEKIAQEMNRHLNGSVSQETELSIGKQLGAELILLSGLNRSGSAWRLDIVAVWVESAQREGQWSSWNIRPDPVWTSLLTLPEIDIKARNAVNGLASCLDKPLNVTINPIAMYGTGAPTEFSWYLGELIKEYAAKNSMFILNNPTRGSAAQTGTITGNYISRAEVQVFLYLNVGDESISSERFSVPVDELTSLGIAMEPENHTSLVERERLFAELARPAQVSPSVSSPAQNNIRIQAWFNNDTRTYRHRDELQIWLTSDRDCYFKVIHIDVNNEQRMIYPYTEETDNRLYAGRERVLFQKYSYILYPPYGTETILIIASSEQFPNIERDYITPSVPFSLNSLRDLGYRGGQHENIRSFGFSGSGEARYNITILKPHEEYTLPAPVNMTEAVSILKRDVENQRGVFNGYERSGYYILNGTRVSYRAIPLDKPQTIEYAIYYEDSWKGSNDKRTREKLPLFPTR